MRTGEKLRRRHRCRRQGEEQRRQRREVAQQEAQQQREGGGDRGSRQHDHAAPTTGLEGHREDDLREPFLGDPGFSQKGKRVAVDCRHSAVVDDPFADRDMPLAVGIGEQRRAAGIDQDDKQQKAQPQRP